MANISQNTFDKTRLFRRLTFQQGRPVGDFELNELQDILHEFQADTREFTGAFGFWGDGFRVEATGNDNEIRIRKGLMLTGDSVIILTEDIVISDLTTPSTPREDEVFLLIKLEEKDKIDYPNIVNPDTGQELALRIAYEITVDVAEDKDYSPFDIDAEDQFLVFATLNRTIASTPIPVVSQSEITDERQNYSKTFVEGKADDSFLLTATGGLGVDIEGGPCRVYGSSFDLASDSKTLSDDALNFIFISDSGNLLVDTDPPTGKFLELWRVTTSSGLIINIEDRRRFTPGGLTGGSFVQDRTLELRGIRDLAPSPTSPQSLRVFVEPGSGSYGSETLDFAGGESPAFTAPTSSTRIDLLFLNDTGSLEIDEGIEGSGTAPNHSNKLPIAEVTLDPGQTEIASSDIRDVRPLFNLGGGGSGSGSSVQDELVDTLNQSVMQDALIEDLATDDDVAPSSTGTFQGPSSFLLDPGETLESNFSTAPTDALAVINEVTPVVIVDELVDFSDIQIEVDRGGGFETSNGNGFTYLFTGGGTNILNIRITNAGSSAYTVSGWGLYYNPEGAEVGILDRTSGIFLSGTGNTIGNTSPKPSWTFSGPATEITFDSSTAGGRLSWNGDIFIEFLEEDGYVGNTILAASSPLDNVADGDWVFFDIDRDTDGASVSLIRSAGGPPPSDPDRHIFGQRIGTSFVTQCGQVFLDQQAGTYAAVGVDRNTWDALQAATSPTSANPFATKSEVASLSSVEIADLTGASSATIAIPANAKFIGLEAKANEGFQNGSDGNFVINVATGVIKGTVNIADAFVSNVNSATIVGQVLAQDGGGTAVSISSYSGAGGSIGFSRSGSSGGVLLKFFG